MTIEIKIPQPNGKVRINDSGELSFEMPFIEALDLACQRMLETGREIHIEQNHRLVGRVIP